MKISLTGLLAVLSTVGLTLAQYNYYDTTSTGSNNKDDNSDKDDNFSKDQFSLKPELASSRENLYSGVKTRYGINRNV